MTNTSKRYSFFLVCFFIFSNLAAQTTVMQEFDLNKNLPGAQYKFSFVHISDTHIGEGQGDYGTSGFFDEMPVIDTSSPAKALREAVKWINFHEQDKNIKFVLVSGDLTGSAEKSEFLKFKEIMQDLNVPYVPVIGNHDVWPYVRYQNEAAYACGDSIMNEVFADVYDKGKLFFNNWNDGTRLTRTYNPETQRETYLQNFSFEYEDFIFYGLDFNPRYHVNKAEPGIGPEAQLMEWNGGTFDWLKKDLAVNPNKKNHNICFFSHHPATDNILVILSNFVFDGTEYNNILNGLSPYKNNLGLWMAGHIHIDYDYPLVNNIMHVKGIAANKDFDSSRLEIINVYEVPVVTGISTAKTRKEFALFPNPNNGKFKIATELFQPNASILLHDVVGNLIYNKLITDFSVSSEYCEFDFSFLPKGSYLLTLSDNDRTQSQRFIKQ